MHLDLESDDVDAEVRRLEALGATRYDHQQERAFDFWVLRDPWGNEFRVLQPEFQPYSPNDAPGQSKSRWSPAQSASSNHPSPSESDRSVGTIDIDERKRSAPSRTNSGTSLGDLRTSPASLSVKLNR
jgi:Glyoxalase-like domain